MTTRKGGRVVIKFGGSSIAGGPDTARFANDISRLVLEGFQPVIVHGGGPEITAEMERRGLKATKVRGLRVTDMATLEVAKTVLARINDQLVSALQEEGLKAMGLAGSEAFTLQCHKMASKQVKNDDGTMVEVDLGLVGEVIGVDARCLNLLLAEDVIPVLYPIGCDGKGQLYNVNADTAAAKVATAVQAKEFVLVTDVPGIMRDLRDPSSIIKKVTLKDAQTLIEDGVVKEGMIPKLEACLTAVKGGVPMAHMINGKDHESIIGQLLLGKSCGTTITK
jgi:acetylglutamate kinase